MKIQLNVLITIALLVFCNAVHADWYAGVAVGKLFADQPAVCDSPIYSCNSESDVAQVRLGYRFPAAGNDSALKPFGRMAIEISYARYGDMTTTGPLMSWPDAQWVDSLRSASIGVASEFTVSENLSVVARLGASRFHTTERLAMAPATPSMTVSDRRTTEIYYGIGGIYRLSDKVALTGDLMISRAPYGRGSQRDLHVITGGLMYSF